MCTLLVLIAKGLQVKAIPQSTSCYFLNSISRHKCTRADTPPSASRLQDVQPVQVCQPVPPPQSVLHSTAVSNDDQEDFEITFTQNDEEAFDIEEEGEITFYNLTNNTSSIFCPVINVNWLYIYQ